MAYIAQTVYAKAVLAKLRANLSVLKTFNEKYDENGETIKIPVLDTEVVVGNYSVTAGKAITQGSNTYIDIIKNVDIAVNEMIDGKVASQVPFAMAADRLDSAGFSLAQDWEVRGITAIETDGTAAVIAEPTKDTIYADILAGQLALDNLNVPREGRYLLIKPSQLPLLKQAAGFIKTGDMSQEMLIKGTVGMIDGLPILQTTKFTNVKSRFAIYNPTWCHLAMGFSVPITIKDLTNEFIGSSAVQGRSNGGIKISRAAAIYMASIA